MNCVRIAAVLLVVAAWSAAAGAEAPAAGHRVPYEASGECSQDPKAVTLYTGPGYTIFFPSATYVPREGAILGPPGRVQHRLYGLPCGISPDFANHILAHDVEEQAYAELGLIKIDVLPRERPSPEQRLELWAFRKVLPEGFQKLGDTFTVTDLSLKRPAFEIDITAPYPLTLLVMETDRSIYYVMAGRPGDELREIVDSIEEFTPSAP